METHFGGTEADTPLPVQRLVSPNNALLLVSSSISHMVSILSLRTLPAAMVDVQGPGMHVNCK